MAYCGFNLGSSKFKSSATLVKVRILKCVFFFIIITSNICLFQFGRGWGEGVVKTLNGKSLPG